jgi:photosystem II stability/assembly factor-like uncharacterized protein
MARNVSGLSVLVVGTVVALFLGALSCSDETIIEPDCEGCFRFHVTGPNSGTSELLRDIFFVDSANGWTVGNDGTILHSDDGGLNWAIQHQGTGGRLWGVHFPNPDFGYVVGEDDKRYRTGDGGDTWEGRDLPGFNLTAVHMFDFRHGFAVGDDVILETNNAATSWTVVPDSGNFVSFLYGVTFVGRNKGWAVGSGDNKILITLNGGGSWEPVSNPATQPLLDVAFVDGSHGWAVGVGGTIVHTTDGGATWLKQTIGTSGVLHGVAFWDADNGVVVGDQGTVFTTTDGGDTWQQRTTGNNSDLMKVSYVDASTFIVCGDNGTLLRLTYSWEECCE